MKNFFTNKMMDKLHGMNDQYWGIAEAVAKDTIMRLHPDIKPDELEKKLEEARKKIGYGYIRVLDEEKK